MGEAAVVAIVDAIVNDDVACGSCANVDGGDVAGNRGSGGSATMQMGGF